MARISTVSAALLEARKDHTKDLKEFIGHQWRFGGYFYDSYGDYDGNSLRNTSNTFKSNITSDWKYDDLIKNHLIDNTESLAVLCKNFEDTIDKYNGLRNSVIVSVWSDLSKELEACDEKDIFLRDHGGLPVSLYPHYARALGPKEEEYYKTGASNLSFAYNSDGKEIYFQPKLKTGSHISRQDIGKADFNLNTIKLADRLEKFLTKEYFNKYENDISKIYSTEQELNRLEGEINKMLDQLLRFPLLPGINCDILKHLLSDDIK